VVAETAHTGEPGPGDMTVKREEDTEGRNEGERIEGGVDVRTVKSHWFRGGGGYNDCDLRRNKRAGPREWAHGMIKIIGPYSREIWHR